MRKEQSNGVDDRRCEPSVAHGDCLEWLQDCGAALDAFDLTFLDPPFNQGKEYDGHNDGASVKIRFRVMTEAVGETNLFNGRLYPEFRDDTVSMLVPLRHSNSDDLPTGSFKWRYAPNVVRDVDEYRSISSAFDDVVPESAGIATGFVLRHPFNGPFLVVQLPLSWR